LSIEATTTDGSQSALSSAGWSRPSIWITFSRERCPRTIVTEDLGTPRCFASTRRTDSFARPSRAGADTRMSSMPSRIPTSSSWRAEARTRTEIVATSTSLRQPATAARSQRLCHAAISSREADLSRSLAQARLPRCKQPYLRSATPRTSRPACNSTRTGSDARARSQRPAETTATQQGRRPHRSRSMPPATLQRDADPAGWT